ncbi:MAG: PAS domain S-box protein [Sedimentisphaerales bacterium]|nr:PAS domain S-box protein [Sedimentisphaerales bacterium]
MNETILLAVRDETTRQICTRVLETLGCPLFVTEDMTGLPQRVTETQATILVVEADISPKLLERLATCKQAHPSVAIVLIVGHATPEQMVAALHAGASNFVVKPVEPPALLTALNRTGEQVQRLRARQIRERQYELLFETMLDGYALHEIICDEAGHPVDYRFLDVNPAFERLTGLTREIVGKTVLEVLPQTEPHWIETYGRVALGGESVRFVNSSSGLGSKWFEAVAFCPIYGQFATIFKDITEQMQAEEALRAALAESQHSRAEVEGLLESARAVLEQHDFPTTARAIFDACKHLLGAAAGYVALLSEDGAENEVLFLDAGGLPCTVDPYLPMPIRGLRAESYRTGKAVYHNDFARSEWERFMPEGHVYMANVMFAPLAIAGVTVGLIGLANKSGDFTDNDARIATAFGELAAIALCNARTLEALEMRTRELGERVKELNCLYRISRLLEQQETSLEQILQGTVDMIPSAWQYSDCTCARICFDDQVYQTPNFQETPWVYAVPLSIYGQQVGVVEVYLMEMEAVGNSRVFLQEEEELLKAVAEQLGRVIKRVRTADALQKSEEKYRTLFDHANDGIFIVDPETRCILDANENAARRLGYDKDELLQLTLVELAPNQPPTLREDILAELAERNSAIFETTHRRKDGTMMDVEISSRVVEIDGRKVYQSFVRDVTERKELEAQIQAYTHELEWLVDQKVSELESERAKTIHAAKLSALGKMATGVAHEINQPLTAMLFDASYLTTIAQDKADGSAQWKEVYEIGQNLASDISRVRRITDHLRTFGRLSGGQATSINLNRPIENSFLLISEQLKHKGVDVRLRMAQNLPLILANPNRMEQVFLNLLSNAEYALDEMARRIEAGDVERPGYQKVLEVSTTVDGEAVVATVRDTGCGIPAEAQERLFEPFFTTRPVGEAAGLGLSIAYGIVTEVGGDIAAESVENEGTTFTLRFPMVK